MFELPPPSPAIEFTLASRGYSKGLAQTDGAQFLVRGELEGGPLLAFAQWKNVDTGSADGEGQVGVGVHRRLGGFDVRVTAAYKVLTSARGSFNQDAVEVTAQASRAFGRLTPRLSLTYSPDEFGRTRQSLYAEAGASFRIAHATSLTAYAGRRERSGGDDYTTFGVGIAQRIGEHITAELVWHDTAQSARGDAYQGRAVGSLRLRF